MSVVCPVECVAIACPHADFIERNGSFILMIVAAMSGFAGIFLTYFLRSRCTTIRCCCVTCDRDVIDLDAAHATIDPAAVASSQ